MPTATPSASHLPPGVDAAAFVAAAQRITLASSLDEALALFHADCVAEWDFDGVRMRMDGRDAIARALATMMEVNRARSLTGVKALVCADAATVVNTWHGGFGGDRRQRGTEVWSFRDGLVVHHRMSMSMSTRDERSVAGRLRMLTLAPRTALAWWRAERRRG